MLDKVVELGDVGVICTVGADLVGVHPGEDFPGYSHQGLLVPQVSPEAAETFFVRRRHRNHQHVDGPLLSIGIPVALRLQGEDHGRVVDEVGVQLRQRQSTDNLVYHDVEGVLPVRLEPARIVVRGVDPQIDILEFIPAARQGVEEILGMGIDGHVYKVAGLDDLDRLIGGDQPLLVVLSPVHGDP